MTFALEIMATVLLIEAITGIISKSELFRPFREFLFNRRENKLFEFAHRIVDCPYCLSVWVSLLCSGLFYLHINNLIPFVFRWFCIAIILHRISNILHFVIDRVDKNRNEDLLG